MSTVRSKGRVTAPKGIRDYLGLKAGSTVTFERRPDGQIVLRPSKGPREASGERVCSASRTRNCADEHRRDHGTDARLLSAMVPVDTNVLLDVFEDDPHWANWSREQLESAS